MPNLLAYLALAIWPFVMVWFFRRYPIDRALILSLMLGYLFLPEPPTAYDFPLAPPLQKHTIPALMAFLIILWKYEKPVSWLPESRVGKALLITFVMSPVLTVVTNTEPVFFGIVGLPGLGIKDAVALVMQQFLLVLPFILARQFLRSAESQREVLMALMWGGLAYSVFMLIEVRLSPQLNAWIYGYYQHQFGQSIRFGGYRPVVFLYHGLWVAFFCFSSVVASFALWRMGEDMETRNKYLLAAAYLTVVLVLAKSLGALIFAIILIPIMVVFSKKIQISIAVVVATLAIGYPILKGADLVPQDRLLAQAAAIDPERAGSLRFRFDNENTLLERAYGKPVFGWGSWGRNHILDPVTGFILTVTDGRWIITIGVYGWVGFIAEFGLLIYPIFLLWREMRMHHAQKISPYIAPMSLLLAFNVVDLLPNATLTPLTWLLSGALLGYAEVLRAQRVKASSVVGMKWQSIL